MYSTTLLNNLYNYKISVSSDNKSVFSKQKNNGTHQNTIMLLLFMCYCLTLYCFTHYKFKPHTLPEGCRRNVPMTKIMNKMLLNKIQTKSIRKNLMVEINDS